jgi:signal recognition particle subunit SRP54
MRMKASVPGVPRRLQHHQLVVRRALRREPTARASSVVMTRGARRSTTTISLPMPFILANVGRIGEPAFIWRSTLFDNLSENPATLVINGILDRLTENTCSTHCRKNGHSRPPYAGALSETDVDAAMREVRRALLEADVALDVVRASPTRSRAKAIGADRGQVGHARPDGREDRARPTDRDARRRCQGSTSTPPAPVAIMMVGLQGSGKTTTTAKIAKRLTDRAEAQGADGLARRRRPAAMEQLAVLGREAGVDTLPIVAGQKPVADRQTRAAGGQARRL